MKSRISLAIMVTGFSGIAAQLLLIRELLIIFSGNELSIGIVIANWLLFEAIGCYFLGKKAEKLNNKLFYYVGMTFLFALLLPLMVFLTRLLRNSIGLSIGEIMGILPIFYSSLIILLPLSLLHGSLFTFGCKVYSIFSHNEERIIGKVYIYEIVGTILGGISWTYLFIPYFNSFQIAFGLSVLNLFVCCILLLSMWRNFHKLHRFVTVVILIITFIALYSLISPTVNNLHEKSLDLQWKGQKIVHYQNSLYGNITVLEVDNHFTFFLDGVPHITTPIPDIMFVEEFVHLPLLSHPKPENILILSGGAGGVINEILKYPTINQIEYTELDPLVLKVLEKFPTQLTDNELRDNRVNIRNTDGRLFLKKTEDKFGVILIGLNEPNDLQKNRFFTKEFFSLVKSKMLNPGLTAICLPGSMTYLNQELKDLNSSLYHTMKTVFPYVRVIPGEGRNIFIASNCDRLSLIDMQNIMQRFDEHQMEAEKIIPWHIEYKLNPGWIDWFKDFIDNASSKINQDFKPIGVYYSISNWNAVFNPSINVIFRWFEKIDITVIAVFFIFIYSVILILKLKNKLSNRSGIVFSIGTTGFSGMIFDLILIFVFQAVYGYIFSWIGMLITFFMAGAATGAIIMTAKLPKIKNSRRFFIFLEVFLIIFSLILAFLFIKLQPYLEIPAVFYSMRYAFLVLSLISGLTVGVQFPLANYIYFQSDKNISKTAGILYSSDLIGGWIAGIAGSVFLLPVLGLFKTCLVVAFLKLSSLLVNIVNVE